MSDSAHKNVFGHWRTGSACLILLAIVLGGWQRGDQDAVLPPSFEFGCVELRRDDAREQGGSPIRLHRLSSSALTVEEDPGFDAVQEFYVGERKAFQGGGMRFYRPRGGGAREDEEEDTGLFDGEEEDSIDEVAFELFGDKDREQSRTDRGWLAERVHEVERREQRDLRRAAVIRDTRDWDTGPARGWGLERIDRPPAGFGERMRPLSDSAGASPPAAGAGAYDRYRQPATR